MAEPPAPEILKIELLRGDSSISGRLTLWEEAPDRRDEFKIRVEFDRSTFEVYSKVGYFRALCSLREELESNGILMNCYGASENVYPSPMIEGMGGGEKAYKLVFGRPARRADLVSIFDCGSDVVPSTVRRQREFYEKWLKSL